MVRYCEMTEALHYLLPKHRATPTTCVRATISRHGRVRIHLLWFVDSDDYASLIPL